MSLRSIIKKMFFLLSRGLFFLLLVEIGLQIMMPIYESKMLHDKQNGDLHSATGPAQKIVIRDSSKGS